MLFLRLTPPSFLENYNDDDDDDNDDDNDNDNDNDNNKHMQEPITRSLQLHRIPVTAFSQTDQFLV